MLEAAGHREFDRLRFVFVVWLALGACLIVGLMTIGVGTSNCERFRLLDPIVDRLTDNGAVGSVDSAANAAGPPAGPTAVYGGVRWTVDEARLLSVDETVNGQPIVVVEATVADTIDADGLRVRSGDVALVWPDGRREPADRFEQVDSAGFFTLDAGAQRPLTIVFKPAVNVDPDFDELVLEVGEAGRVPVRLPLNGEPVVAEIPVVGRFEGGRARFGVDGGDRELVLSPRSISLGLDAGPYRAAVGERVISVVVDVAGAGLGGSGQHLQPAFWQMVADTETYTPVRVQAPVSDTGPPLTAGETRGQSMTLLFVVDADRNAATLVVGADTPTAVEFDVTFPVSAQP